MSLVLWLFEIGYILQHIATIAQILRIKRSKNTELVSLETNIFFLIGAIARMFWMWDSMLKKFYLSYIEILVALGSLVYIIFLYDKYKLNNYYTAEIKIPIYIKMHVLLPVILLLSFFFHPGSKGEYYFTSQMFVSLNIYSEAIGLLPQLYIIAHTKDTGNVSQYYGVCLAVARFFRLLFWFKMYAEGNKFLSLIIADLIHTLFLFYFVYTMFKNWNRTSLPTEEKSRGKIF